MLSYLGQLYVTDGRFSKYINRFGNGDLAAFLNKAIEVFCSKEKSWEKNNGFYALFAAAKRDWKSAMIQSWKTFRCIARNANMNV